MSREPKWPAPDSGRLAGLGPIGHRSPPGDSRNDDAKLWGLSMIVGGVGTPPLVGAALDAGSKCHWNPTVFGTRWTCVVG